jgi:hypothetical protein
VADLRVSDAEGWLDSDQRRQHSLLLELCMEMVWFILPPTAVVGRTIVQHVSVLGIGRALRRESCFKMGDWECT